MEPDTHRQRIEKEVQIDLHEKSVEHLLADIHDESKNALKEHAPTTRTLARFASLLAILSRKAEESSSRLERHTITLIYLTFVLALFGLATLFVAIIQIYLMAHPPK